MSEFHVEVVRLGKIEEHPSADRLEITRVHGGYPCIVRKGDFKEGDLAVYIPIDTTLPETDMFSFLSPSDRKRLRAKKLRGVFSMGLIVPAPDGLREGQDVAELLGIKRYEPPPDLTMGGENEAAPSGWFFPVYTDIEGLRRWPNKIRNDERVVVTEKLHGANGRFVHDGSRLWVGSRTCIKRCDEKNLWWKVAADQDLNEKLARVPERVFFGEVYGQVQDLKYGHDNNGVPSLRIFDVFDVKEGRYLDHNEARELADFVGLDWVPELYIGRWDLVLEAGLDAFCEGQSLIADNVREGFVVKPLVERYDDALGRVILKMHGEGFLTRKGG